MTIFEQANQLEILTVLDAFWISYKKDSGQPHMYTLLKDDGRPDNSFKVNTAKNIAIDFGGDGIKGWPFDIVGRLVLSQDTTTTIGKAATIKAFIDKGLVSSPEQKTFVKSLKDKELLNNFDDYKLNWYKKVISAFLMMRGVPHDFIQKNENRIGELFKDIWYYENYYCNENPWDEPKTVSVFMFPCYDQNADLIWMKLRRKDGKTIRGKKSLAVGKTGLLYDQVDTTSALITEWEIDYLILKLLGYPSVIWNLCWVQSGGAMIKSLLAETNKVICLYDNDVPGEKGKQSLAKTFGRQIFDIEYPVREDKEGKRLWDINDFYNAWYDSKEKWNKIIKGCKIIGKSKEEKEITRFIQLDSTLEYYDTKYKRFQKTDNVAAHLGMSKKELFQSVTSGKTPSYENLCYYAWWKPNHYNTLDEDIIVTSGGDAPAELHPDIEYLISNVCGNKKNNIEWVHQTILYKLTHLNDVHVPALILYWAGWSGKGTFLNLLSQIFWGVNTQVGLGQKDLEWSFDSYQGWKLIVEFKEVSSWNKFQDKKMLDRIKSFVWEPKISVNAKHQNVREVDSIAWFIMSSNHPVPIQLDSKHSGNRRFSVIKTGGSLDLDRAEYINHTLLKDKETIKSYINWLYDTYPEIVDMKRMSALDNDEKANLEDNCEWVANQFFEWLEKKWPYIQKLSIKHKNTLLQQYCTEMWEDYDDLRFKQTNFDLWLSHRYEKSRVTIDGKQTRGYNIIKTPLELQHMPEWELPYPTSIELGWISSYWGSDPFR